MSKIYSGEYTSVTISESITLTVGIYPKDSISIDEVITLEISHILLTLSDSISISDIRTMRHSRIDIYLSESISIGELAAYRYGFYDISVIDSVSISESILVQMVGLIIDEISIETAVTLFIPILTLPVYTSVTISDVYTRVLAQLTVHDNVYIRTVFNESLTDTTLAVVANTITSTQLIFASAKRTAAVGLYESESFKVSSAIMLRFHFDVTVEAGTSSLGSIIQISPDKVTWYDAITVSAITATGQYTSTLTHPGIYVRVRSIITGTSFTYSCKMTKHMVNKPSRLVYA